MLTYKKLTLAISTGLFCSTSIAAGPAGTARLTSDEVETANVLLAAPVVVTATRVEQSSFDLPVAIDVVEKENIQTGQLQMTLSESLIRVPGITAQNRTQMSQDPQISTRGFGSRSSFGVRGLRLYVDGIPLSMPDGIGQPGNIDLGTVRSIEVMRGPFSALYGNSSGGVVQLLTEDAPASTELSAGVLFGSYDTRKQSTRAAGTVGGVQYLLNYSHFDTDGYRHNSESHKEQATAKLKFNLGQDTTATLLANWFDQNAQDPLGLPRVATANDPSAFRNEKSVPASAYRADTRVSRDNTQVGLNLEHRVNDNNTINLVGYTGERHNLQYLSLSPTTGAGRASEISRDFWGTDLRWNNRGQLLNRPYSLTAGISYGKMDDDRMDITATNGIMLSKTLTNINRDEKNTAKNFDQYIQAQWSALEKLDLHAGVRKTKVRMEVDDALVDLSKNFNAVNASNVRFNLKYRDGTGKVTHEKTTPVIGAVWKLNPAVNLYANYGKGFETPTFIEVAYDNATEATGPNLGIKPSTSDNYEIGAKAFISDNTRANLAIFRTTTDKEIVATATGTYSVYMNAGKTSREGVEASIDSQLANNISLYAAYSYLNAEFDSAFTSSTGRVESGNKIPGTYRTQIYAEAAWKYPALGFMSALEARHNSKVYVDDLNSDTAPSYTIFNLRAGFDQNIKNWRLSEYARVENLFDKDYIGSVRVNDSNLRFFEPAAGRNWLLGLNATYRF